MIKRHAASVSQFTCCQNGKAQGNRKNNFVIRKDETVSEFEIQNVKE